MTMLADIIAQEISANGPMTIARYMDLCLGHSEHGYYTTKDPFGLEGDFTTAPEISQMFGEMVGVWLVQCWLDQGAPKQFILAELGPGRGSLMLDILRVAKSQNGFIDAMQIHLVETSPTLRDIQANTLKNHTITFVEKVENLPELPLFLVANEFFDALPVQQFVKTDIGWQERRVDYSAMGFEFVLDTPQEILVLDARHPVLANGLIVEHSPISEEIAHIIGRKISANGGAALIIDYGEKSGIGDTFQAIKGHSSCDPLMHQGRCDLTCHVQFQPLAETSGCATQFCTQGAFLENMGITARANALAESGNSPEIAASHHRLVHPDEMGTLFKVMALRPKGNAALSGFET